MKDPGQIIEERTKKIRDGIGRLIQVAVRLRREDGKSQAKAASFEPEEKLVAEFKSYRDNFCQHALRPRLVTGNPKGVHQNRLTVNTALANVDANDVNNEHARFKPPPHLQDRVRHTMLDRWRRISYRRHHASDLAGPNQKPAPKVDLLKSKPTSFAAIAANGDSVRPQAAVLKKPMDALAPRIAGSAATTVHEDVKIDLKADLHLKGTPSITTKVRADQLVFPRPPTVRSGVDHFICPFCGLLKSVKFLQKSQWQ